MSQKTFVSYNGLRFKLARAGFKTSPNALATFLLENFVGGKGVIMKTHYHDAAFKEEKRGYQQWIESLRKAGFIEYLADDRRPNTFDWVTFKPGPELVKYVKAEITKINKEILSTEQVATKSDVDRLAERVAKMEQVMKVVYKEKKLGEIDPPDFKKYLRIVK